MTVATGEVVLHCRADLLLGDGLGPPDEDCQGVDAHEDGHRKQNGSNDLHSVIRALNEHVDSQVKPEVNFEESLLYSMAAAAFCTV